MNILLRKLIGLALLIAAFFFYSLIEIKTHEHKVNTPTIESEVILWIAVVLFTGGGIFLILIRKGE